MVDMQRLLRNRHVTFGGPNRRGWLSLQCPRCGKRYLGWHIESCVFFCWQCRQMALLPTLAKLLNCNTETALAEVRKYSTRKRNTQRASASADAPVRPSKLQWPHGIGALKGRHKRYLERRGLDADEVVQLWKPRGTTGVAESVYANRIYAPLVFNYEEVSWQGRTILDSCSLRYVTCKDENEVIPSKSIVYGWDYVCNGAAVVVEGLFDVWKGGPGCVHTFGISWTPAQLNLLSRLRSAVIAYDNEPDAQRSAELLAESLDGLGVRCAIASLGKKDFGSMPVAEARAAVKQALQAVR